MRLEYLIMVLLLPFTNGCQLPSRAPSPQWTTDFQSTDSLVIRSQKGQYTISDAETLDRLREIYTNANWNRYRHTLPADLGVRTITLQDGGTKLLQFNFTGTLWVTESYSENWTAELSDSDAEWLTALFDRAPDDESIAP